MFEVIGSGLLGSIFGGVFRLVPEVLKWLDKKNERQHELAMFTQQCQLESQRGAQRLAEIGAQRDLAVDSGVVSALEAAIKSQAEMAKAAGGWAAKLSTSVRPVVTYWLVLLWSVAHVWFMADAWASGLSPREVFKDIMSADFVALVAGTINYWFLDRTLKARGM